ncbi:MAG: sulfotransferase [Dehalococcoidia bacterium]|nr:sulfotransferase [Dehalococcoidia bacterium]
MDRFVVGTGRCGSTLLSRMLAEQPSLLSVFEFFNGLDMTRRFSSEEVDGKAFAALISQEHPFVTMVLRRGYEVPEITYPFGPNARYTRDDGLPWVLVSTLPRLTDDPDALFDETVAFASGLPRQPLVRHYRQLFAWWAQRLGRAHWLERSGSSIDYLGSLHELFPDARFLHLHRDGPETALSMREHHAYRLAISLMFPLSADDTPSIAELRGLDPAAAPTEDDPITRLLQSQPPVEYFGRYWTQELVHGFRALPRLDAAQYLAVRFEDLFSKPKETLRAISEFFQLGPDEGGWIDRAAALVRGIPPARFGDLPKDEQERLAEACRIGAQLVGRAP